MDHYEPSRRSYGRRNDYDRPPPPPSYDDRPPPPPASGDMFHFRGAASNSRSGDSYRPGGRRDDFNFSAGNAPSFRPSNDYPGAARRGPRGDGRRPPPRHARDRRGGPPRRFGPKPAHDRDLMRRQREPTPEQLQGMNEGHQSRFKVLGDGDDASGSDSEAMDTGSESDDEPSSKRHAEVSEDDSNSEDDHPRAKRARVISPEPAALVESRPKWSNPDPYTVLPPPDESQTKKKDVVKLIRKAKVEAPKPAAAPAEGEDFISLNFDDDFAQNGSDDEGQVSAPESTFKRSFSHLDNLHPDRTVPPEPAKSSGVNMSLPLGRLDVWPPRAPDSPNSQYNTGLERQDARDAIAPARKETKKRKRRDQTELGSIVDEWHCPEGNDPAPWFSDRYSGPKAENWLHNEILDFYNYVKPRDFESQVRNDLIQRVHLAVRSSFPNLHVHAFGSFASGLYLPTADMDLVACSTQFLNRGSQTFFPNKRLLYKVADALKKAHVADPSSITVIAGARVPLVKFVEKTTGLRVDISFENDSGLIANKTFQVWKEQFPAMPIIVALIKQFLVMRGFSEVFTGGLGGYSVICLVITILRVLQGRFGDDFDPMQSLDTVLMTFFVHFGREFNVQKEGIQMEPWQIVGKHYWRTGSGKVSKPDRLLIIDPNNYDNDISGGSAQVVKIFEKFEQAFKDLNICMTDAEDAHQEGGVISILERVWGGNYELFEMQRTRLRDIWQGMARPNAPGGNQGNPPGNASESSSKQGKQNKSGPQNNPGNHGKQGKGHQQPESKSNKKQKRNNDDAGSRNDPMYIDSSDEVGANPSGPAAAAGKRRKTAPKAPKPPVGAPTGPSNGTEQPKKKKNKKKEKKEKKAAAPKKPSGRDASRAESFKQLHPGVSDVPKKLTRDQFKDMMKKHGRGLRPETS